MADDDNLFSRAVKAAEGVIDKFKRGGDVPAHPEDKPLLELAEPVSPRATPAVPRVGKSKDGETIGI